MRAQQGPQFPAAAALLICHSLISSAHVATASGANNLNDGEIAGVVVGSVGGALLLGMLTFLVCCVHASRGRRTGDLTWSKTSDLEAAAIGQTAHQPLPGPCGEDLVTSGHGAGGGGTTTVTDASFPGAFDRTDTTVSPVTGQSMATLDGGGDLAPLPELMPSPSCSPRLPLGSGGRKIGFFRGRSAGSTGGGVTLLFGAHKGGFQRHSSGSIKDKHLQVSKSTRVEPSAELELTEPFQPAATNMGPPLSKSSMLLRWLNGADDGCPEAVAAAAQIAAAAGADRPSDRSSSKGAAGRGNSGEAGGGAGLGTSLDRLPLLSLAAQHTGIVWNKMPPSVASSPAVSVVESSTMHMLRGSLKCSDAPAAAHGGHTLTHVAAALEAWHGGNDRYPASFAQASLDSFSEGGSLRFPAGGGCGGMNRAGIVFDYVMRPTYSTSSSRANTGGGMISRALTAGGGAVASNGGVVKPVAAATSLTGFGADDAFTMGTTTDEHMALQDPATTAAASGWPWLHQIPPTKLSALQEAEAEEEDGEEGALTPLPQPPLLPQSLPTQLSPVSIPHSLSALTLGSASPTVFLQPPTLPDGRATDGSPNMTNFGWTHFGHGYGSSVTALGRIVQVPAASNPDTINRLGDDTSLPISAIAASSGAGAAPTQTVTPLVAQPTPINIAGRPIPISAFANVATSVDKSFMVPRGAAAAAGVDGPTIVRGLGAQRTASERTIGADCSSGNGGPDGISFFPMPGGRPSDLALTGTQPGGSHWASPQVSPGQRNRRAAMPPALHASQSNSSFRSQTSLASPSLSIHYPDTSDAAAAGLESSAAAALAQALGTSINDRASAGPTQQIGRRGESDFATVSGASPMMSGSASACGSLGSAGSSDRGHVTFQDGDGAVGPRPPQLPLSMSASVAR
ncbi:hypothetical protein VaNZ11_008916 [Volvox africanus]|uniref:Uncharacterized protein n=1 Tax=Volvox africanus TaxID=51714 RepID=A0ABQ5S6V4_9CHLO|nr:hypothetical protein VaNZ11_008916 [Volvox africanus]